MDILFATRRGHLPDRVGGAQHSMHALLTMAEAKGHRCRTIAALQPGLRLALFRAVRYASGRRLIGWPDRRAGYVTHRTWECLVTQLFQQEIVRARPDLVITDAQGDNAMAKAAAACGVPTLLRVVDVGFVERGESFPDDPLVLPFANSHFVADRIHAATGRPVPVVFPIVRQERCRTPRLDPSWVTFVNPIPVKGLDTALEVARRLPHRGFLFVESWPIGSDEFAALRRAASAPGNVIVQRWRLDIRPVYARTAVLLVPSLVEEAFGRVALEAQANGIPVLARRVGGLPESVGEGGILLDPAAPAREWADTLEGVLANERRLADLSAAARRNAARPEFAPEHVAERFLELAREHALHAGTRPSKSTMAR